MSAPNVPELGTGHEDLESDPERSSFPYKEKAVPRVKYAADGKGRVLAWTFSVAVVFSIVTLISRSQARFSNYVPSLFLPAQAVEQCPDWFAAVADEFSPWKEKGGIDLADVEAAQPMASSRFQIINGSLYAEDFKGCWQTRKRYSMWGLLMFLRHFGDVVPDVDFMFDCGDMPQARRSPHPSDPIPALWGYNRQEESIDLTLPDWSFWGWPEVEITRWEEHGQKIMDAGRTFADWEERKATAFWKGALDVTAGLTAGLRANLTACTADPANGVEAYGKDWRAGGFSDTRQWEQCGWRYRIYAEGFAWSVSMKYGMACGAVMLVIDPFFAAFYHPGLAYGTNALLVRRVPLCESFREQITWANAHPAEAEAIGRAGLRFVEEDLSMRHVYDYMLHKFELYAQLQTFTPMRGERSVLVTEADILREASEIEPGKYLVEEVPLRGRPACRMHAQ
ncbi:putative lipopolysaccharide-modifying protein [Klebsormidium nitens]|uniref:Putative lipopolysaccharide-modifying protein n=1 Tax=Klebsormidium nitens TaxID=105231 RepID=A0A1Y1IRV9_KLENI|nr:putative lipopolysaccharide-modifying protein [Klebsormidium nitens]|eukprot:GAQ92239.1 putative lipopolysaccharide-modifying protein [Klebsormidium nitens]